MLSILFEVDGIGFVNEYEVELGTETGLVHITGKTKGTKMTMTKGNVVKRSKAAERIATEETTPVTSIDDLM